MSNYTFADLLHIFFRLRYSAEEENSRTKTQEDFAREIGVARRTMNNWFKGTSYPRYPEDIERIAKVLGLTMLQTDLMLFSIKESWVRYGTPIEQLKRINVLRYQEINIPHSTIYSKKPPSIGHIEREWRVIFSDTFKSNYNRWGLGKKNDGTGEIERQMEQGSYNLSLQNFMHGQVFMGGDSQCFAPEIYYVTVQARLIKGETEDEGYALIFEEISDGVHAVFRVREKFMCASVVQTFDGGDNFIIYVNQESAPTIRPKLTNKLAILAIHQDHWFYINDHFIGHQSIPRLPYSRLDVGVTAGSEQNVICRFRNFRVYAPNEASDSIE